MNDRGEDGYVVINFALNKTFLDSVGDKQKNRLKSLGYLILNFLIKKKFRSRIFLIKKFKI